MCILEVGHKMKKVRDLGFRVGTRCELIIDTKQPRMAEFKGVWAIDDPIANEHGFMVVGDDIEMLLDELIVTIQETA